MHHPQQQTVPAALGAHGSRCLHTPPLHCAMCDPEHPKDSQQWKWAAVYLAHSMTGMDQAATTQDHVNWDRPPGTFLVQSID